MIARCELFDSIHENCCYLCNRVQKSAIVEVACSLLREVVLLVGRQHGG